MSAMGGIAGISPANTNDPQKAAYSGRESAAFSFYKKIFAGILPDFKKISANMAEINASKACAANCAVLP